MCSTGAVMTDGTCNPLWAKLLLSILDLLCFLFVVCRPTFSLAQELLLSEDIPSTCRAGGLFLLWHNRKASQSLLGLRRSISLLALIFVFSTAKLSTLVGQIWIQAIVVRNIFAVQKLFKKLFPEKHMPWIGCQQIKQDIQQAFSMYWKSCFFCGTDYQYPLFHVGLLSTKSNEPLSKVG